MFSVSLLYAVTLLHFATGSAAFLRIPKFDPRSSAGIDEIVLVLLQVIGGVAFAITCRSGPSIGRILKWSPLFIVGFAALTWMAALVISPLHIIRGH